MLSGWRAYFLSGAKLQPATEVWVHGAVAASSYVGPFLRKVVKVAAAQFLVYDSSIELQLEIVFFYYFASVFALARSRQGFSVNVAGLALHCFANWGKTDTGKDGGSSVCALMQQKDTIS